MQEISILVVAMLIGLLLLAPMITMAAAARWVLKFIYKDQQFFTIEHHELKYIKVAFAVSGLAWIMVLIYRMNT